MNAHMQKEKRMWKSPINPKTQLTESIGKQQALRTINFGLVHQSVLGERVKNAPKI